MNRFALAYLGAFTLALPQGVQSRPAETAVPFELIKGHIYVQGYVNDKGPYVFIFDTGASGMGRADVRLVHELGLKKVGEEQNSDGINVAPINVVGAKRLRLGSVEKRNVKLLSRDYNLHRKADRPVVMGIFGADFFSDHLLTIDYPARALRLSRGSLVKGAPGVIPYEDEFAIPVCFKSGCYTGRIDTGSSLTVVIPKNIVGKIETSDPVHAGSGTRANTISAMYEMQLREPMRIAGITITELKLAYADPSDEDVNIGSNFLKDYVLTIDQRHKLLKISRP